MEQHKFEEIFWIMHVHSFILGPFSPLRNELLKELV